MINESHTRRHLFRHNVRHYVTGPDYLPLLGTRTFLTTPEGVTRTDVYAVDYDRGCIWPGEPRQETRVIIESWDGRHVQE